MQGVCTTDEVSPTGNCIYGDDLVTSNDLLNVVTLPSILMTCDAVIKYLISINRDYVFFCKTSGYNFGTACCQTCASKIYFLVCLVF
jgi:hypothetical protein